MENNRSLFDALDANVKATGKELSDSLDRRNQYIKQAQLPTGDNIYNMAEIAKEEAKIEEQAAIHEKAKLALEKLLAEDKQNGRQSNRILAAIQNFESFLAKGSTTEEALNYLSAEDRLVFTAQPELINNSQRKYADRFDLSKESLIQDYTVEDELNSKRGLFKDPLGYVGDIFSALGDTAKTTVRGIASINPSVQGVWDAATLGDDALKKGSDISRKLRAQEELKELSAMYPHLAHHFSDTSTANELTTEDHAFLNSKEGQQYMSALGKLQAAEELQQIDTSLGLQLNQRTVENSIDSVMKSFKIRGVGDAFLESATTLATNFPAYMIEGIRNLGPALMLSGNPTTMGTALSSTFAQNLSSSITALRNEGKGLDEINYAKVAGLGFLAATVDAMGDRLLTGGLRKFVNNIPGNILTKQNARYTELVDDFVAKGLTTEQAANVAMKIVGPETIGEAYKAFSEVKGFAKKAISETAQQLPGYDSTLGRALRKSTAGIIGAGKKAISFGSRIGFSPKDLAKEMVGEGLAEATGGALQNIAQDQEVTQEGFLREALLGGAVGLGMQPTMLATGGIQKGINKLGERKYLSDKDFSNKINTIQKIMDTIDYENHDDVRKALEETTKLQSSTDEQLNEVNGKLNTYKDAVSKILQANNMSTSLVTQSGELINPENSGLIGKDLKQYTKIFNDSQDLFAVKETLENRSQQLKKMTESLDYAKAKKGHTKEFANIDQLADLQKAEDQASTNRAKDFESLSDAHKVRYMQDLEGMSENQAKEYVANLDTEYTAQDIINNANAGNRNIDAQKLQENIDYFGIDANHLNQIKDANVLEALANIDDTQTSVDNYNKVIKKAKLDKHKDLYRRVSSPKESANARSEAIKNAKFNVFNKKLGNPSANRVASDKTALQSVLNNNGDITEDLSNIIGYIHYGDPTEKANFINSLNATGKQVFEENVNYLDNTNEIKLLDDHYSQYNNRHTKAFDFESEAKKAIKGNALLRVKENPYSPGKWVVKSLAQEFLDNRASNTIHDIDTLKQFIKESKANILSNNDIVLLDKELAQGKTYEDLIQLYQDAIVNAHKTTVTKASTRVKEAMGVLGYNAKSLKTQSFSSKIRTARKEVTKAKERVEQETKETEKLSQGIDEGFKNILTRDELTELKTQALIAEKQEKILTKTQNYIMSNLFSDKSGQVTVSADFANQIRQLKDVTSTKYYQKASKAEKVTSLESIWALNREADTLKQITMLADSIDDLIRRGVISINTTNTALQVFNSQDTALSKHLYVEFDQANPNQINTLTFEPNARTVGRAEIRVLGTGANRYATASTRDTASMSNIFSLLITDSRSIGNTGNMSDGGRSLNVELNESNNVVENSPAMQEELFNIRQNGTSYLHNNIIRDLDSTDATVRNEAIRQLRDTVAWFNDLINSTIPWSHAARPYIDRITDMDGTVNNNRAYFIRNINTEELRAFNELHRVLSTITVNADILNQQVVKELINNPSKLDSVFNAMHTPLGMLLLDLARPHNHANTIKDSFDDLEFVMPSTTTAFSLDAVYNQCGGDPLTRNIVFNSIIWDTPLFSRISANVTQGGAGNMGAIRRAGAYIRKVLDNTKCPGRISVHVLDGATTRSVNTQDNFHVIFRDVNGAITHAYTLTASLIHELGYASRNCEIYTNNGERLSNPTTDLGIIHTRNSPKYALIRQLATDIRSGGAGGGNVFRDFLKIDFMSNSLSRYPGINNTTVLRGTSPFNIKWEYMNLTPAGHSLRHQVMNFVTELETVANGLQQSYTSTTFTRHDIIETLTNGNLREFTNRETRDQLTALSAHLSTMHSDINVTTALNDNNVKQYYRDRKKDLEEALRDISMWTPNNNAGGSITSDMINDFVTNLNRQGKTRLTPQERLVANFLIEYGNTISALNNALDSTASPYTTSFNRRNAHVSDPAFINVMTDMVNSNEFLKNNFTVDAQRAGIFNIPDIMESLLAGEEFPGITDTIEVSGLADMAALCVDCVKEISPLLSGKETAYNAHGLFRHFMREKDGTWFTPNNILYTGVMAVANVMPSLNLPQSEEFRTKLATQLAKADPQARMRANLNLTQIKGTNKDELIKQITPSIRKAMSFLKPKNNAVNPNVLFEEMAGFAVESMAKKGYLKKTLFRTDPTAPDVGCIVTDPTDTKGCTVFYGIGEIPAAEAMVSMVRNSNRLTGTGRTVNCITDSFGMDTPSRNNFTVTDNPADITDTQGNVAMNTEFIRAWGTANIRDTYGVERSTPDGTPIARYFEEIPNDPHNLHRWCQINLGDRTNPNWVTVPAEALYSDKATNTFCTPLALRANATQYIQPQHFNMETVTQILGTDLENFRVHPDGTVYHTGTNTFPCHIRLDLPATQQPEKFYEMFGLTEAYKKYQEAGSSTQQAEAQEALIAHFNNILDLIRVIAEQHNAYVSSRSTAPFNTWLGNRNFHFHLKNSVNARIMYDSVFNPRDAKDIRMFFTTVQSHTTTVPTDLGERNRLQESIRRGRNIILASNFGFDWDKTQESFIDTTMNDFYNSLANAIQADRELGTHWRGNSAPTTAEIERFLARANLSVTVPVFDRNNPATPRNNKVDITSANIGIIQCITQMCTSSTHLNGTIDTSTMFYIRGEIDGITNGTAMLLGKANRSSDALRDDTAELWNKVGVSLGNMSLFEIKQRQVQLGTGPDAYTNQGIVTDADIIDVIRQLNYEQLQSGNDANTKKDVLDALGIAFEVNKDLAPQLTRDIAKQQAMPYNYLAGKASRQLGLLESLCTAFNHALKTDDKDNKSKDFNETRTKNLLEALARLNGGSITLHNINTAETRVVDLNTINTLSLEEIRKFSVDFGSTANERVVNAINEEAAAKFVEAPGVKLSPIAEEAMQDLAKSYDLSAALLLAELKETIEANNGTLSHTQKEALINKYIRHATGPSGSLSALGGEGISINKHNFKQIVEEFIDSVTTFVPVKGGGITVNASQSVLASRGAGNVPMQVHMLDGTVVQDAIVRFGTKVYNLMIHDAVEGGVSTLLNTSKRMNNTYAYTVLTENPWNSATAMLKHIVEDIRGSTEETHTKTNIMANAIKIYNSLHPNHTPIKEDFIDTTLARLNAYSVESLINTLNVLDDLASDPTKTLAFNQYYGGKNSAFILGQDDFEYTDANGNNVVIRYSAGRTQYFNEIREVMLRKFRETHQVNSSAFTLVKFIKQHSSQTNGVNNFPHIIYALSADPAKVNNTATADLDLTHSLQNMNLRSSEELLQALSPNMPNMGELARKYHSWLFRGGINPVATQAWSSYVQEYQNLRTDFYNSLEDQDLNNFVNTMILNRPVGTNTVGAGTVGTSGRTYDDAVTRTELHDVFSQHFDPTNPTPIPTNFAAAYMSSLIQHNLTTISDTNKKIARNAQAHTLIHRKSTGKSQLLAGFLALTANYKDANQNSKELNWILDNLQNIFPTTVARSVYERITPYSKSPDVKRIHIPMNEFDKDVWEAGVLEAEQETIANPSTNNPFCDPSSGTLYPRNSTQYATARADFRNKYFTRKIHSIVNRIISNNLNQLQSGREVHLVVEGNSYLGAIVASALANHSYKLPGLQGYSQNIKVAMLPVEASPEKLEENWTLGILNAQIPASSSHPNDTVTIVSTQGDKPDPVLESIVNFYNPKASKVGGTSKSLNIPKYDIQGNKVHVGSKDGHNSGKMMSPNLATQSIILTKTGEFSKLMDSNLVGVSSLTHQAYIDNKNMNDIPQLDSNNLPVWDDAYKTALNSNQGHALNAIKHTIGNEIKPYTTLGIHINVAKLLQQGILEGADESSERMLQRVKTNINIPEIIKKFKDTIEGDSRGNNQGISLFNHSVKLGPSLVNIAFIPSADFVAIPRKLLKNLTQNPHTNEYKVDNIVISKDLYYKLFNIQKNNKYLNPNNPGAFSKLKNTIQQNNQVIVVSLNELGDPNDPQIKAITDSSNKSSFFSTLQDNIRKRAYRSLDIYANRVRNNRRISEDNPGILVFKDNDLTANDYDTTSQYLGKYSRVDLSNSNSTELAEFWNSVAPLTETTSQAHREYSSSSSYETGSLIDRTSASTLGNSIHALQDGHLKDLSQSLYGIDELKYLFNHPGLAQGSTPNSTLENTIKTILETDMQVMIGIENTVNDHNTPLAITGIDAQSGRQFINISMQTVGSNIAENNREALAHELTHRVVAEGLKNENLLRQVRVLYEYVKANITEDDFQCDYATRKEIMDYVFPKHRSNVNVLQEFLAYALTNKHLITAIGNMRVDSATIEALNAKTSGLFNKICAYVTDSAINHMDEISVQRGICQLFADMAKIAKKNWTRPEERLKYADPSFGMDYTDIDKHPDLDATRGIPVGDKALLGAIEFDYKQAQGSYDEFIRYINRDDYSEEHLGNSAYTPESIGLTRWIENCCRKFSDNLYGFMNMLVPVMGGTTESNQIYTKAALQLKVRVDQMRERLITAGTKYMRGLFDTCEIGDDSQISQDRRRAITDTILDTDFKVLLEMYSYNDIKDMVANPKKLNQEIQKLLNYPAIQKSATYYSNACKGLANRMVHGVDTSRLGLRNAYQIFNKWGSNNSTTSHYSADGVKQIDTLITLYAIQALSPENKERLLDLMELPKGEQLINGITTMHRQLMLKQERDIFSNDNNVYNIPKGWTHRLKDSDKSLQLIPRSSLEMYEYQGYEYVTDANVSPEIKRIFPKESDLVYVKHQHILNTPYVPGIAPITRKIQQPGEQYTINLLGTGRLDLTVDPDLRPMEFKKLHGIHARQSQVMSTTQATHPITEYDTLLEPIFNTMGKIIGYNLRPNDKTLAKFTKEDTDADHIFGSTLGNIAERHITPQLNQKTAENLANIYEKSKHKDRDFKWIGLNETDEEVQLAYKMLPAEIRDYFQERYPGKGVPIEKQYFARIVGHKPISAGDIKELEKYYNKAMNAPMDYIKKAFHSKYAVAGEYWAKQMADIGKQALVIQSGTVTMYNWISNLMLLTMRGVSLQDAIQLQAKGWKQLQRYKELGQQIDDLKVKALMQPKIDISNKINGLQSEIENLDIYPLLKEGFYSSIASNEITSKDTLIDQALKSLPQEIRNTMGYKGIANLLAAKGTTVHKWLQDLAVDSDFVGRYALYTHLKDAQFTDPVTGHTTTMSEDKRLGIINDMFIDYTVPLPKPIEWAEKVGLYVFSKYMFRTQKNLYSILTSNWQEVGKLAIAQMMLGGGAMGSNPFQSLMLPGQVLSHFNTPGGLALDGLSGLPLVRLLN